MYVIKTLEGNQIDGGQTREQVIRALKAHGYMRYDGKAGWRLPRKGRAVIISNPLPMPSCRIEAV